MPAINLKRPRREKEGRILGNKVRESVRSLMGQGPSFHSETQEPQKMLENRSDVNAQAASDSDAGQGQRQRASFKAAAIIQGKGGSSRSYRELGLYTPHLLFLFK